MCVSLQRGLDAGVAKLLLSHFGGYPEVVQQGSVDMPKLVPCDMADSGSLSGRLEDPSKKVSAEIWTTCPIGEDQVICVKSEGPLLVVF